MSIKFLPIILSASLVICINPFSCSEAYAAGQVSPVVTPEQDTKSGFDDYIKMLGVRTMLSKEDARTYSATINDLVGSYFYVNDQNEVQLLGRPDGIPKATTVQLKDKIEYQAATDDATSITATLPWLSALFKAQTKTSILLQDIATVVGTSDPKTISAHRVGLAAPAGKPLWFISGATVTLVSATNYSNKSFEGSTVIQIGGSKIYTRNALQNAWVISINKVPVGENVGLIDDSLKGKIIKIRKAPVPSKRKN
jgi:hypothetical protein